MTDIVPAKTGLTRVFLIEGRARVDHAPVYQSVMRMGGLDASFGDIEKIEAPHPTTPGAYVEIGQIKTGSDRPTSSLEGRHALKLRSELLRLAKIGCPIDVQLHYGDCEDLSDFDSWDKVMIFEDVSITNLSTDDLGSLTQDDEAAINETADISAKEVYEVVAGLSFSEKAAALVTNEVVDVVFCDNIACGDCGTLSDGCQLILAVTVAAGGSPGTEPDMVFSPDGGTTWYAHDIDSMVTTDDASGVACLGSYAIVVSNDTGSHHYVDKSELDGITDPAFTEVTTNYVGAPNDIFTVSTVSFVVGDGGYIYSITDATAGPTVLDAGSATTDNLRKVHAYNTRIVVAVGENGAVVYSTNGSDFAEVANRPVGVATHLNGVVALGESHWIVATDGGQLYYTLNSGASWTEQTFPGSGSGVCRDLFKASDTILYLAHDTTTPRGRILQSVNAGRTWKVLPRATGTLPVNDRVTAVAACTFDPNRVVGVGLGDDGSDGFVVFGSD